MEDHVYCAPVMCPTLIVVKEEPIWKLAKKEDTVEGINFGTNEEPELEWAVSNDVDVAEDPLLLSDTEESSLSTDSSLSSGSNSSQSIEGVSPVNEEKRYFVGISQLNDDNNSDDDKDSLDFEVAELLKQNNELFSVHKKEKITGTDEEQVIKEEIDYVDLDDEAYDKYDEEMIDIEAFSKSDENKLKPIFQSFLQIELSAADSSNDELVKINESKNRNVEKKKYVNNPRSLLKINKSNNISEKYSLRKFRPVLKRYSPVDFTETIERTVKKQKETTIERTVKKQKETTIERTFKKQKETTIERTFKKQKDTTIEQTVKKQKNSKKNKNLIESSKNCNEDLINIVDKMKLENPNNNSHEIEYKYYDIKRHWHNTLEKHRRTLLAELFKNLLNAFPSHIRESDKMPKVHILNTASDYIQELERRDDYLDKTKVALKEKQIFLKNKLTELKKNLSKSIYLKMDKKCMLSKIKN